MWETSLLQNWPLQIRLVWSETSGFWVFSDAFCAGCRGIRGVVGLWPVCLRRVVHGRRVGEGTAWGQWGRVRVFLGCGIGDGDGPSPRPCPGFPLSRERRWGGAVGRAGAGGGVPPPGAPLDTGFRRYDDGGCGKFERRRRPRRAPALGSRFRENDGGRSRVRDARELVVAEGPSTGSGRTESRSAPAMWVGGGVPPPGAPLDTGFRRYDGGVGVGSSRGGDAPRRAPALGSRFRENDGGGGGAACRYCVGIPHPAPLDSCLRRNDAKGSVGNGRCWWWRAAAPHLWIPAFAGTTMAGVGSSRGGDGPAPPPLQSTNGHVLLVGVPAFAGTTVGGLDDGAYAAVHVYGGAGYEAGSL